MARATRVNVGAAAVRLASGRNAGDTDTDVLIRNRGAASIFLGNDDVTTATGYEVGAGESVGIQLGAGEPLYAIAAAGPEATHVLLTK